MEKTAAILELIKKDCLDIQSTLTGVDKQEFLTCPPVNMAVTMSLFSIAELSKTLPAEFQTSFPDLPFKKIVNLHNAAHENKCLDLEEVWAIAAHEITKILQVIEDFNILLQEQ